MGNIVKQIDMSVETRPAINYLAKIMEMKLRVNDHKPHWSSISLRVLFSNLLGEVEELKESLGVLEYSYSDEEMKSKLMETIFEAADVANFCAIIADNCRTLIQQGESRVQ
jgi:hypothetical protein